MMKRRSSGTLPLQFLPLAAWGALLAACGGSGEGLDENGRPIDGGGGSPTLTAEFESIQDNVFTPMCTTCHAGAAAPLGFRLDEGSSYAMLVNAPSTEVPSLRRVNPGNPDASYLIQKIEGRAAVGARMPLNQPPLPQQTIAIIRQWIANGAQPAASGTGTLNRFSVVVPAEDEILTRTSGNPLIAIDGAVEPTSLNSENFVLEREADGVAIEGTQVDVRTQAPTVLSIVLPASERRPGNYQLRIRGTGRAPVLDMQGQPLGSDLTLAFTIEDLP
jgi:hypothetical protein